MLTGWSHLLQLKKQQLQTNHVIPDSKTHGLHVTEKSTVKDDTCLTNDEKTTHHRHTNSAYEGIAELDGPTSVPVLLELLREKDGRIKVLGENISRVRVDKPEANFRLLILLEAYHLGDMLLNIYILK